MEQLRVELVRIRDEGLDEVTLAEQAKTRDADQVRNATHMRDQVVARGFVDDHIAIASGLIDPCQHASNTAVKRHTAAEAKVKAADGAIAMVDQHVAMAAAGAAGPAYQGRGA